MLAKVVVGERPTLFWLNPADTPGLKLGSLVIGRMAKTESIFLSVCIIAVYWTRPWEYQIAAFLSIAWLLSGLVIISYSFLYFHYYLSAIIRREKNRQVARIQSTIESYERRIERLNVDEFSRLSELVKLYNYIASVKETAIDVQALRSYILSIALLVLSFLGGQIDWVGLLSSP